MNDGSAFSYGLRRIDAPGDFNDMVSRLTPGVPDIQHEFVNVPSSFRATHTVALFRSLGVYFHMASVYNGRRTNR
jgi:hypothetical protein